ncbi:methyltransferase domain-containing protein [Sandaracinus amylolyticus]|uniref:methyltransferase domain-containing protein n=1 Tax=Sandaracinus amylolyticus TaxID=927083 RepID=UPI001F3348D3|nr:methyltransferase domain-containing protein [Sandaracinus amylolyticus]UJR83895.1 Hypothetical protein I5071_59660 [Sandaracinus amylolyticus]
MELLDRSVSTIARGIRAIRLRTPSVHALGEIRAQAASRALDRARPEARAIASRLRSGDPSARRALADIAQRALDHMRCEVREEASRRGVLHALAIGLDERFSRTDEPEWLDDPHFDRAARVRVLEHLDALNVMVGGYAAFFDALRPYLGRDRSRPTRVLDLAAGHGGFALAAARMARDEGLAIELCATDLKPEYLEIGEAVARRDGLDVRFAVQDALDLSGIERGAYDVIVCTQSLHHFPPGLVAVLASEASRVAGRGVVLIDGYRSRMHALVVGSIGLLRFRDVAFAHDGWVSFRRFFVPEELEVLARLGPEGDRADARWMPPTHCVVTIPTG